MVNILVAKTSLFNLNHMFLITQYKALVYEIKSRKVKDTMRKFVSGEKMYRTISVHISTSTKKIVKLMPLLKVIGKELY